jgi:murein DD-endopeptidase MepM/ murein hydrolase activator NlpD
MQQPVSFLLLKYQDQFGPVVPFNAAKDKLALLDFGNNNNTLTPEIFNDTAVFTEYINRTIRKSHASYGIGGYLEIRTVYSRSKLFDAGDGIQANARTIHLGIDIWGAAGTPVFAPFGGTVHSFAFNDHFGDYGATIILQHQLDGISFHTLFGHLSLEDLRFGENQFISLGEKIGSFGSQEENGHWPPHLHFQVIIDMEWKTGDYPGACCMADLDHYSRNCPDPDLVLHMMQFAIPADY